MVDPLLWLSAPAWTVVAGCVGLALGSFAGLVVDRLPRMVMGEVGLSLSHPPSRCNACGHRLRWWHNVPVASYLFLRGRCGFCGTPIGALTVWMELVTGALWAGCVAAYGPTFTAAVWASFFSVLWVLLVIDWRTLLLPDALTLPLLGAGLLLSWGAWTGLSVWSAGMGALTGFGMLRCAAWGFERYSGEVGMGGGDPKLMAALGAWLGPLAMVWVLLGSSVLHVLWFALQSRYRSLGPTPHPVHAADGLEPDLPQGALPFGPPLIVAALLVWACSAGAVEAPYPFRIEAVATATGNQLLARNEGPAVLSVEVHLQGQAAPGQGSGPLIQVVPAFSERVLYTQAPADEPTTPFVFRSMRLWGDAFAPVDASPCALPFEPGRRVRISQAYGSGLTTHQGAALEHAIDFDVPQGTPVLAARAGLVVEAVSHHTTGGPDPRWVEQANYVKLLHDDGTLSTYGHLAPHSVTVALGQHVQAGARVGLSGQTGYAAGPHLHFCVSKPLVTATGLTEHCLPVSFANGALEPVSATPIASRGAAASEDRPLLGLMAWEGGSPDLAGGLAWRVWPWWAWLALLGLVLAGVWSRRR